MATRSLLNAVDANIPAWLYYGVMYGDIPQDIGMVCIMCCGDGWNGQSVEMNTDLIAGTGLVPPGEEPYAMVRMNELRMIRQDGFGWTLKRPDGFGCGIGLVYLVRSGDGLYKVGFTKSDPKKRLATLQTGCPHRLEIHSVLAGSTEDEIAIHKMLDDCGFHVRGEWFSGGEWVNVWEGNSNGRCMASDLVADLYQFSRRYRDGR